MVTPSSTGEHSLTAHWVEHIIAYAFRWSLKACWFQHVTSLNIHKGVYATVGAVGGHNDLMVLTSRLNGEGVAIRGV